MVLVVRAGRLVVRSWQRLVVIVVVTAAACSLLFINRCKLAPHAYSGPVYSGLSGPAALSARALVESPHRARSLTLNFGHPPLDTAHSVRRQASRSTFHLHSGTEGPGIAPEGPGIAPEGSRIAPEGSRIAPEGPAIASEGPAIDPERPAIAPEGPRIAPKHPGIVPEVTHPPREIFRSPRDSGNPYREAREGFRGRGPNFPSVTSRDSLYNQPPPPLPGRSSLGHAPHSALFEDEEQRAAYTRHLLQQIALLEQEVASLHAAAALAGVASDKPGQHAETLGGRREPLGAPHTPAGGAQQTAPQSHHGSSHFAPPPPSAGGNASSSHASTASHASSAASESACSATLQQQILQSEVVRGLPLNNEYEVVPFSHFSWSRVYPSELGLGKRVVEKPIGYRRKDVLAALTAALDHLNAYQNHGYRYSMDDFIEGSFRTIPTAGTQYELVFRDGSRPNTFNSNDNNSNNINNNNVNTNNNNTNSVSSSAPPNHSDSKNSDGTNSHSPSPSDQQQAEVNSRQRRSDAIDERVRKGISGAQTKSIDRGDNIQKPSDSIYNNNNDNDNNPSSYNFHNTNSKKDGFHDPKVVGPNIVTSDVRNSSVVDASRRDDNDDTGQKKMAPEASGTKNGTSSGKHARQGNGGGASLKVVTLMRPFAPITVVRSKTNTARQLINIILPLSGRLQTFQRFMTKLTTVILPHDRRIFLTVVYFGDAGLQRARNIITKASREANFRMVKLLTLNETFSRGKALQVGAQHWSGGDVLLFMCDVDVVFSTRFLDRCRLHATPGRSVYYPVIFSLYNPGLVYPLQGKPIPEELDQLVISRDTGFWRDFGYGMTCQYRSDFLSVNGFDQEIVGWGGEDVLLYRKYVRSSLAVIRSTDPGIFHLWHPKLCSSGLPGDQYRACLSSRALSEASHAHLGLVAFKKDLEKHPVGSQILPGISAAEKNLNTAWSYQVMGEI